MSRLWCVHFRALAQETNLLQCSTQLKMSRDKYFPSFFSLGRWHFRCWHLMHISSVEAKWINNADAHGNANTGTARRLKFQQKIQFLLSVRGERDKLSWVQIKFLFHSLLIGRETNTRMETLSRSAAIFNIEQSRAATSFKCCRFEQLLQQQTLQARKFPLDWLLFHTEITPSRVDEERKGEKQFKAPTII